jgi:D-3-phosphoglycerate dehydrogenase / 2-oxoglutarate reductase
MKRTSTHLPIRITLVENIHLRSRDVLEAEGFQVKMISHSPLTEELDHLLADCDVLGIRSKTKVSGALLEKHKHLLAVGAFCIGTDQVDLMTATKFGTPVFNAPYSNTRSVAELVIAEIISLSRQLADRSSKAHQGIWEKTADGSNEVRGKTLGIIGYGHIGSQVSVLAEAFGMTVIYFDAIKKLPLGNSQSSLSLENLLAESDFVSLHVPDTQQTRNMIREEHLALMRKGSYLINASRGTVVDIEALARSLKAGHLAGAAIDVFPIEPASNKEKFSSPLQGISNVILTPHIGGSTLEAQEAIGVEVAQSFLSFLKTGSTRGAVNFPQVDLPKPMTGGTVERLINVHQNVPGVLREINSIVSSVGANILAQALSTDPQVGYLILDMVHGSANEIKERVDRLETSIKTRALTI